MDYFVWSADPVLVSFGSVQLRWYGLLFVSSFFAGLLIAQWIYKREGKDPVLLDDLFIYVLVGAVVGARLMHCFAYEPEHYLAHPLEVLMVWQGGLASHGGMLGVIISVYIFTRIHNESYVWLLSRMTITGMMPAMFVRIGNFFNSEILGNPTDVSWAIVFERVDSIPRHPVQLYEAISYLLIFVVLVSIYRKISATFATKLLPGLFLVMVFGARFVLEFFKTKQEAYTWDIPFSTGQMLSVPFVLLGIGWIVYAFMSRSKEA